jgi:hypothetical protein
MENIFFQKGFRSNINAFRCKGDRCPNQRSGLLRLTDCGWESQEGEDTGRMDLGVSAEMLMQAEVCHIDLLQYPAIIYAITLDKARPTE